ncbi:hypothetical protein JB92DRAFT_3025772 [Gautieria morchelliformis]|nr:hypothetical protein JB92DRAFT_3025772 [Gautieria morchelliformis]
MGQPGQHLLYMPDLIVVGLPHALQWQDAPLPQQQWHQFPFPAPLGFPAPFGGAQLRLVCKRLEPAVIKTEHGVTKTADQVENMPFADQLQRVRRCRHLWQNLVVYSLPNGPGVARPAGAPAQPLTIHTGQGFGHSAPFPGVRQQAEALDRLFPWFVAHNRRKPVAMTSEPSVQDEVHAQIIEPLNMLLETRYANTAGQPPQTHFYPQWGRSCPKAHRNPGNQKNAGFPDFLLYLGPHQSKHAAIMEVKTWWAYSDNVFASIFSTTAAHRGSGVFDWSDDKRPATLLKQLWGELHFFQAHWGACTNGRKIVIFARTGQNELTLSEIHNFDEDPSVHRALIGMCFAAIDERGGLRFVTDTLCPVQHRESLW